jgi:hypothetical protein
MKSLADYVRSFPPNMTTPEIVEAASQAGLQIRSEKIREVRNGSLAGAEAELRRLAIKIGILRADELVREVSTELEKAQLETSRPSDVIGRIEARIGRLGLALSQNPTTIEALFPEIERLRERRRDILVRLAETSSAVSTAELVAVDISTPEPTLEELLAEHDAPSEREHVPHISHESPPSSETRFAVAIPRERAAFEMSDAHRATVKHVVDRLGDVRPLLNAVDAAPVLERLEELTIPDEQASWLLLPTEVQRVLVKMLVAIARDIQDVPGVLMVLGARVESVFRRLTAFSRDHRPGYVHGLSRGHLPKIGTWSDDAIFAREELMTWLRTG